MKHVAFLFALLIPLSPLPLFAQNGEILDQDLSPEGYGYTIMVVRGTAYEMGYAHGSLLVSLAGYCGR